MIFLVLSREERLADVQFVQDAAEGPHVDGRSIRDAQHDLRRPVETRLDVGVYLFVFKAARSKIDDLDARFVDLSQQDVLWLEIAVDDVVLAHVVQRNEYLDGEPFNKTE